MVRPVPWRVAAITPPAARRFVSARQKRYSAPMRCAVTGGTGLVGFEVARALLRRGHEVRILARDPHRAQRLFDGAVTAVDGVALQRQLQGCTIAYGSRT